MGKVGRPELEDTKQAVPLRLRKSLIAKVKKRAKEENRSVSNTLEQSIIKDYE